jgi:hypothetical protein
MSSYYWEIHNGGFEEVEKTSINVVEYENIFYENFTLAMSIHLSDEQSDPSKELIPPAYLPQSPIFIQMG